MIGSKVFAVSDDGNAEALEAGSYTMENGNKLTVGENSEILDLGEEKEAEDVEASEEMSEDTELAEDDEAAVDDWAGMEKRIKNLEDAVADLKADKVEASAELSEEVEEKTEMSKEVMGELMTQIEELKGKIVELSGEAADEGITYSPEGTNATSSIDLRKLSSTARAAYYINNK
jgi:TolA-binding protein